MTTTVKLITHDWPVEVTTTDKYGDQPATVTTSRVEPHSETDFHITDTRSLQFAELPRDAAG
jgi:hypothetical protein